jgi:hypothetical protein
MIDGFRLPNGLDVRKERVPLGVVAVVYEARPNVTIDAAALCLKSGNAIVLRGSSSAAHSNAVLARIAAEAAAGARQAGAVPGEQFEIELDRRRAIGLVLERARPGDAILLAGKGHEPRMLIGDERLPWNDRRVAEEELARLGPFSSTSYNDAE